MMVLKSVILKIEGKCLQFWAAAIACFITERSSDLVNGIFSLNYPIRYPF